MDKRVLQKPIAFTRWEYKHVCWDADGQRVTSSTENSWPTTPTPSDLDETALWSVTTGGGEGECFSQARAVWALLFVRTKSATSDWSAWNMQRLRIVPAPGPPSLRSLSRGSVVFGVSTAVSATVIKGAGFTRVQQYVSCRSRDGTLMDSRDTDPGISSGSSLLVSESVQWNVTTGDDPGECYHNTRATLRTRVYTRGGWSRWATLSVGVTDPACTVDITADTDIDRSDKWFVDCTDLHRTAGVFNARRYQVILPNRTNHHPAVIEVTSSVDFVIKLVGGTSTVIDTKQAVSTIGGGGIAGWHRAEMIQAIGVTHTSYTIEISTQHTNTTFNINIDWFTLEPPTNLKANGHSTGTTGESIVTWRSAFGAKGYEIRYECGSPNCADSDWAQIPTNRSTLTGLQLNTLYTVKVRSKLGNHVSDESEAVCTYPTTAVPRGERVAFTLLNGFWRPPEYSYVFCSDTIPDTGSGWENQLKQGMASWQAATDGMVRLRHTSEVCDGDDENDTFDLHERTGSQVWFDTPTEVSQACEPPDAADAVGCALGGQYDNGEQTPHLILISDDLATDRCGVDVGVYQVAAHEAGHALGLGHNSVLGALMTRGATAGLCEPQPFDIVAVKALYQSLDEEDDNE